MNQLTAVLATQKANRAADSRFLAAISDRLGRFERSRVDRGDRDATEPQSSAPAAFQPFTVVAKTLRQRSQTPPKDAVLDPMQFFGMLPKPSDQSRDPNRGHIVTSRPLVQPNDRHDGAVSTVLPPPHAAFASLPPPRIPQPLPSAPSMPSVSVFALQSVPNAAAKIAWDAADSDTLLKAASRQHFTEVSNTKIRAFLTDAELILTWCSRPRDRWGYFVLAWLGPDEAEKVRCSNVADSVASYENFCNGLIALF